MGVRRMPARAFREEIADRLDLPAEAAGCLKLTLLGSRRAPMDREALLVRGRILCVELD